MWILFVIILFIPTSLEQCNERTICPPKWQPEMAALPSNQPPLIYTSASGCMCHLGPQFSVCFGRPSCKSFPIDIEIKTGLFRIVDTVINRIKTGEITKLSHLESLQIENNHNLTQIDAFAFKSLENLKNLSISYNSNLNRLENGTFAGLHNLKLLSLVKNGFIKISVFSPALAGRWLPKLYTLVLSENNFHEIRKEDFDLMENSTVEELFLVLCRIETIDSDSFTPLKHLKALRIGENSFESETITKLVQETVKATPLRLLNLYSIGLRKQPPRPLLEAIAQSNITNLYLARNQFENIGPDTFPPMPNLELLDLSEVLILNISNKAFVGLPKLKTLLLRGNKLSFIPDGVLLEQLTYLDLKMNSGSRRASIIGDYFSVYGRKFTHMRKLKELDLGFNSMHAIYNDSFTGLVNLQVLGLKNATIYFITPKSFEHLKHLRVLNLENNMFHEGLKPGMLEGLTNLKVLLLGGCGIRAINTTENPFASLKNLVHLGLERNKLLTLTNVIFPPNLVTLDLSQNMLQPWSQQVFTENKKLTKLLVGKNKFSFLTDEMKSDFEKLTVLDLEGNPFSCQCMYNWKNAKILRLIVNQSLFCAFPEPLTNLTVQKFYATTDCSQQHNLKIIFLPLLVVLAIILVFGAIYYYRWYLRYWIFLTRLYLARKGRIQQKTKENNTNFLYDAFVSYSNEDRNFVIRLVGMLETHPPYLKLCVYERDFQIGTVISESVLESVAQSRKTLLIISDSYAKSQWCRWESQIAEHHRLFFNGENGQYVDDSLILIKLGPVNQLHLTPTLKFLLKTRIYLQWESDEKKQKLFWERLRSTLAPPVEMNENTYL